MDITESDRRAFERLVADHGSALCAIAYAVLRARGRSEECAQEALLVAWRDRDKAPSPITTAWVCAIARNLARNAARRRQELPMVDESESSALDARAELIADEDIARANAALAALPERYREAVVLHFGTYAAVRTADAHRGGAKIAAGSQPAAAHAASQAAAPLDVRAALVRRFPAMLAAHRATLPSGAVAIAAAPTAEGLTGGSAFVDLDFKDAPIAGVAGIISHALATPIWVVTPASAVTTLHVVHADAVAALDTALAPLHASRTEVAALRIAPDGRSDAAALGGAPMDVTVRDVPLDDVLAMLQPVLAMPIGRFPDDPDDAPTVTLDPHGASAGRVLQAALDQCRLGYELTTGFVVAVDD